VKTVYSEYGNEKGIKIGISQLSSRGTSLFTNVGVDVLSFLPPETLNLNVQVASFF